MHDINAAIIILHFLDLPSDLKFTVRTISLALCCQSVGSGIGLIGFHVGCRYRACVVKKPNAHLLDDECHLADETANHRGLSELLLDGG